MLKVGDGSTPSAPAALATALANTDFPAPSGPFSPMNTGTSTSPPTRRPHATSSPSVTLTAPPYPAAFRSNNWSLSAAARSKSSSSAAFAISSSMIFMYASESISSA